MPMDIRIVEFLSIHKAYMFWEENIHFTRSAHATYMHFLHLYPALGVRVKSSLCYSIQEKSELHVRVFRQVIHCLVSYFRFMTLTLA